MGIAMPSDQAFACGGGWGVQGGFRVRSLVDGAGAYSVAHRAGLLPTELTGMWGWILLRSPHQRKGSLPAPAPTKESPVSDAPADEGGNPPDAAAQIKRGRQPEKFGGAE